MKLKEKRSKPVKETHTQSELNEAMIALLCQKFGVANAIRFVNQFRRREGDYVEQRKKLFERLTIDDVKNELKQLKKSDFLK